MGRGDEASDAGPLITQNGANRQYVGAAVLTLFAPVARTPSGQSDNRPSICHVLRLVSYHNPIDAILPDGDEYAAILGPLIAERVETEGGRGYVGWPAARQTGEEELALMRIVEKDA